MKTKYQNFEIQTIKRDQINFAYYNPRKISEEARKKLKKVIKERGLKSALTWNKQTGNLVAGHQRLRILDILEKNDQYMLDVCVIDESLEEEVKDNIFMNNQNAMGEMDFDLLKDLHNEFPNIDFIMDLGFDKLDLDLANFDIKIDEPFKQEIIEKDGKEKPNLQKIKDDYRKKQKEFFNENGESGYGEENDYYLTFVFNNNFDKRNFLKKININEKEKFVKSSKLYDILKEEYQY